MAAPALAYRDRKTLPKLGMASPKSSPLFDTNVFINAWAGHAPAELKALFADLSLSLISGPVMSELSWTRGRLDPKRPQTAAVLAQYDAALAKIAPSRVLVPDGRAWAQAGELAGAVARGIAGEARSIKTAFDRIELINDAITAVVALRAGATIITNDSDFDLFMQLEPALYVIFYD